MKRISSVFKMFLKTKKGTYDFAMKWPHLFFFLLFSLGFIIVFFASNSFMSYLFVVLVGFMTGRFLFQKAGKYPVPFFIVITGFLLGYIIALMISGKGDWRISLILFLFSNIFSYRLFEKGYFAD